MDRLVCLGNKASNVITTDASGSDVHRFLDTDQVKIQLLYRACRRRINDQLLHRMRANMCHETTTLSLPRLHGEEICNSGETSIIVPSGACCTRHAAGRMVTLFAGASEHHSGGMVYTWDTHPFAHGAPSAMFFIFRRSLNRTCGPQATSAGHAARVRPSATLAGRDVPMERCAHGGIQQAPFVWRGQRRACQGRGG